MPPSSPLPRPRILQCVTHLALGGAERVALTIVEALRNDFDFEIFAVRGMADGEVGQKLAQEVRALGVPLHIGARVPMRFGGVITSGIGMARVIRRVKPDLIHLHTEIPEAAYAAMTYCLPGAHRIPLVRTIHNSVYWGFWRAMGLWCDRRMSESVIAGVSSNAIKAFDQLRLESGAAAPPQPPVTIFNGVREPRRCTKPNRDFNTEPIRVIYGGRFEFEKGTDLLPEILSQVQPPNRAGAHLVLFGSGAHAQKLQELASQPPPGWTIEMRKPIPNFANQLGEYDLVLVPSRYEGLGLVAIEAFLAGTPVVATDAPGLIEALPPEYPLLARAGDAASFATQLQQALGHPESWAAAAETGRAFAQARFAINAMANAYRTLYQRTLAQPPR